MNIRSLTLRLFALGVLFTAFVAEVKAFNQPPLNLGATSFIDGGAPKGIYYINYLVFVEGRDAMDKDGEVIPGNARVNAMTSLHQFYFKSDISFLGGKLALDVVVPVVAVTAKGSLGLMPLATNTAGMGDLVIGPAVQWDNGKLLGGPVFQRVETDLTLPTGKYDKNTLINPGTNLRTLDSYYSFVWFFHPKWETSWRVWYAMHGKNKDDLRGTLEPGDALHFNFAASYKALPKLRIGGMGYYLTQIAEDKIGGIEQQDSKERVLAVGPGFVYSGQGLTMILSHPYEIDVRNRFKGSRTTLQLLFRF